MDAPHTPNPAGPESTNPAGTGAHAAPDAPSSPVTAAPAKPRRRWLRWLAWSSLVTVIALLIAGELVARFVLGLGDPPLFKPDNDMRYVMVPDRTYRRLFKTISYNHHSMRGTPDFPAQKSSPDELRVFCLGDSVINGGPFTDDAVLATKLLADQLRQSRAGKPALVMNASAGSWGPIQELAYVRRFGLFEADILVMVFNHEDALDDGKPRAMTAEQPTSSPVLALQEVFFRYLPLAWNWYVMGQRNAEPPPASAAPVQDASLQAIRDLVALARSKNTRVAAVLHASRTELDSGLKPGLTAIRGQLRELGVPIVETAPVFRDALRRGDGPYRDDIHPSPQGQLPLLQVLRSAVDIAKP